MFEGKHVRCELSSYRDHRRSDWEDTERDEIEFSPSAFI
jgi:hypothetical protein